MPALYRPILIPFSFAGSPEEGNQHKPKPQSRMWRYLEETRVTTGFDPMSFKYKVTLKTAPFSTNERSFVSW